MSAFLPCVYFRNPVKTQTSRILINNYSLPPPSFLQRRSRKHAHITISLFACNIIKMCTCITVHSNLKYTVLACRVYLQEKKTFSIREQQQHPSLKSKKNEGQVIYSCATQQHFYFNETYKKGTKRKKMNIACVPCIRIDFLPAIKKWMGRAHTKPTREKNKLVVVFFVFVVFIAIVYSIRVYHYILYPLVFLFVLWVMEEQRARMYFLQKRYTMKNRKYILQFCIG